MFLVIIRFLMIFLCSYAGYEIAVRLNRAYISGDGFHALAIAAGIALGILIGYVLGGVGGRALIRLIGRLEGSLESLSAPQMFFGTMGLIAGLVAALLPSVVLLRFSWPGWVISLFVFCLLGLLGAVSGVKKSNGLARAFGMSPHDVARVSETATPGYILDTSAIIDGRIADIARDGFLEGVYITPKFVLNELQAIADSQDSLKRNRGKRGLEMLNALQQVDGVDLEVSYEDFPEAQSVDSKLVRLAKAIGRPIITDDYNLNRVAELQGVRVLNINELANSLKPVALPGELLSVKLIKGGKEPRQGVGYLDDGTMVVVEGGKEFLGEEITVTVTSVIQTPAGRMIFARPREEQ